MKKKTVSKNNFTYFTTPFGRKLVFIGAGCTTVGLFAINFLPNTLFLDRYRNFVQCYRFGEPSPVPDAVQKRFEKAINILNVPQYERKVLKLFTVYGFDLFLAGSTKSKYGGIIGIPTNYSYNKIEDINRPDIRFRNNEIKWDSESGELLQESLVLSEDEQVFGICKTILQMQSNRVLLNSVFPCASFLAVYTIGSYLNHKLMLLTRPLPVRLLMYGILGLFGLGSWSFMKDYNQIQYETESDKKLCALGPEYVEAGARFYDKLLKKNMALRALIGDDTYTAKGNENYFVRQKSLPLTVHKAYFEEQLKVLEGETMQSVAK